MLVFVLYLSAILSLLLSTRMLYRYNCRSTPVSLDLLVRCKTDQSI